MQLEAKQAQDPLIVRKNTLWDVWQELGTFSDVIRRNLGMLIRLGANPIRVRIERIRRKKESVGAILLRTPHSRQERPHLRRV